MDHCQSPPGSPNLSAIFRSLADDDDVDISSLLEDGDVLCNGESAACSMVPSSTQLTSALTHHDLQHSGANSFAHAHAQTLSTPSYLCCPGSSMPFAQHSKIDSPAAVPAGWCDGLVGFSSAHSLGQLTVRPTRPVNRGPMLQLPGLCAVATTTQEDSLQRFVVQAVSGHGAAGMDHTGMAAGAAGLPQQQLLPQHGILTNGVSPLVCLPQLRLPTLLPPTTAQGVVGGQPSGVDPTSSSPSATAAAAERVLPGAGATGVLQCSPIDAAGCPGASSNGCSSTQFDMLTSSNSISSGQQGNTAAGALPGLLSAPPALLAAAGAIGGRQCARRGARRVQPCGALAPAAAGGVRKPDSTGAPLRKMVKDLQHFRNQVCLVLQ